MLENPSKVKKLAEIYKPVAKLLSLSKLLEVAQERVTSQNLIEAASILKELGYKRKHTRKGKRWYIET